MTVNTTDIYAVYEQSFQQAMKMFESGKERQEILNFLVATSEKAAGSDTLSSILVFDEEGLLRDAASPKLPTNGR